MPWVNRWHSGTGLATRTSLEHSLLEPTSVAVVVSRIRCTVVCSEALEHTDDPTLEDSPALSPIQSESHLREHPFKHSQTKLKEPTI